MGSRMAPSRGSRAKNGARRSFRVESINSAVIAWMPQIPPRRGHRGRSLGNTAQRILLDALFRPPSSPLRFLECLALEIFRGLSLIPSTASLRALRGSASARPRSGIRAYASALCDREHSPIRVGAAGVPSDHARTDAPPNPLSSAGPPRSIALLRQRRRNLRWGRCEISQNERVVRRRNGRISTDFNPLLKNPTSISTVLC
jgi:hypothetical protein